MKLTPFGFVNRAEVFVNQALALPPKGGGQWSTQRTVNFMDHTGSLQILLDSGHGSPKARAILNARLTGGPRDEGIQGWTDVPSSETREAFVLRETNAYRAMQEIFDIVEKALSHIPEWDNSVSFKRPEPPPRILEPLIPEIQKPAPVPVSAETPSIEPVTEPEMPQTDAVPDMQSFVDSLLSPDNFDQPAPTEEEPVAEEAAAEDQPKSAKKSGRGRKPKS